MKPVILCVAVAMALIACGCQLPRDPEGTSDRIRGGVIRVGMAENSPLARISDSGQVSGAEAVMVEELAADLHATVEWTVGGEGELMRQLESYELDLVIGGIPSDTPWSSRVALTEPYDPLRLSEPTEMPHVLALPPGENRWLYDVQSWLNARLRHQAAEEERRRLGGDYP